MPVNRNALIRYKTIDKCLQNRYRRWTLNDLIDACSEALYEYEGIDKGVSRRSVQADIQMMRSDKLGYNAPIIVVDRKYYTYVDPEYSITNIPLTEQDLGMLTEAVEFMKQFQGFSHFQGLDGMVQKLEDHIYSQKTQSKPVIDIEKNEELKGLQYLDVLYQAIINKRPIHLIYQSFKARQADNFDFHPYLLKEFRNRWFVIGVKQRGGDIFNLALDRIEQIEESQTYFQGDVNFDPEAHYKDVIGVSVSKGVEPQEVLLFVNHQQAPYLLTKPLHHSQLEVERDHFGVTLSLFVQHNFELEKEILSYGESIQVLAPDRLKRRIKERLSSAIDTYRTDLKERGLLSAVKQLKHNGSSILNYVYSQREVRHIHRILDKAIKREGQPTHAMRQLLQSVPALKGALMNRNLLKIIRQIDPDAFLTKAIYFDKTPESNWFVSWHQDIPINVAEKIEVPGYDKWTTKDGVISVCPPEAISKNRFSIRIQLDDTDAQNGALRILPGSHKKVLSDSEIKLIVENSVPVTCEVSAGGVQLMKPLLLHASSKSRSQKRRRVIHLEFASVGLEGGLVWAEKEEISKR